MRDETQLASTGERTGQSSEAVAAPPAGGLASDEEPSPRSTDRGAPPATTQRRPTTVAFGNWWNRTRYGLYAPIYAAAAKPLEAGRRRAIERLDLQPDDRILILGSGPGVDLEYLPTGASVTAVDITPAMVRRTEQRAEELGIDVDARVADAQDVPFDDDAFDAVLLHLVLTVVPRPNAVAAEVARVLNADGRASIYDKFVRRGERASLVRRALNPVARTLFSDLTRRLEPMVEPTDLVLGSPEPYLGGLYTVTVARPEGRA